MWSFLSPYVIVGGTVDITIHEVVEEGKLKLLNYASGGAWGGTCVDAAFEKFLRSIVGMSPNKKSVIILKINLVKIKHLYYEYGFTGYNVRSFFPFHFTPEVRT